MNSANRLDGRGKFSTLDRLASWHCGFVADNAVELVLRLNMSTYLAKPGEIDRKWHIVDANDQILGRLAAKLSIILQGKHKPVYTAHVDTGDFVIVINSDKIRVTGRKADVLEYDTYSGYAGGRRVYSFKQMYEEHPERLLQLAVKRMLPKNKLGRDMLTKLKIFSGIEHPHAAQQPKELKF